MRGYLRFVGILQEAQRQGKDWLAKRGQQVIDRLPIATLGCQHNFFQLFLGHFLVGREALGRSSNFFKSQTSNLRKVDIP